MPIMIGKVTLVFAAAFCAVVLADRNPYRPPQPSSYRPPSPSPSYNRPSEDSFEDPKYDFVWEVNEDSNNFDQQEQRDGDNTKGVYTVDLPDGRRQTVTYFVDGDSGFQADVQYSGDARYPASNEYSAPRPSYSPPRTTPRPTYTTPRPSYTTPRPVYTTARPAYTTPRPTYAPRPTTRRPSYTRPTTRRPAYSRPTTRRPSYSPPRNTYSAPNSLLAAFGVGK